MQLSSSSQKARLTRATRRRRATLVLTAVVASAFGLGLGSTVRFKASDPEVTVFDPEQSFPPLADWPPAAPVAEDGRSLYFQDRSPALRQHRLETETARSSTILTSPASTFPQDDESANTSTSEVEEVVTTQPIQPESVFAPSPWANDDSTLPSAELETAKNPTPKIGDFTSGRIGDAPSPSGGPVPPVVQPADPINPLSSEQTIPSVLDPAPAPNNQSNNSREFDTSQLSLPQPNRVPNLAEQIQQ